MKSQKVNKVVLISGTTSGIGRETALLLARQGHRVFAGYRREAKGLELLDEAKRENLPLSIVHLDITLPQHAHEAVVTILKEAGRIDVLINNAGYGLAGPFEELELEEVREQFETNVFGLIRLSKAVVPIMRKQRSGTIIHLSSVAGHFGYPFLSAYCASKHAVEAFGEAMRSELKPFGIHTVLVEPGMIRTNFVQKNLVFGQNMEKETSPYYAVAAATKNKYFAVDETALHPIEVAKTILKIIETRKPRLRYQVGKDALLMVKLKRILPWHIVEFLISRVYNLKKLNDKNTR